MSFTKILRYFEKIKIVGFLYLSDIIKNSRTTIYKYISLKYATTIIKNLLLLLIYVFARHLPITREKLILNKISTIFKPNFGLSPCKIIRYTEHKC